MCCSRSHVKDHCVVIVVSIVHVLFCAHFGGSLRGYFSSFHWSSLQGGKVCCAAGAAPICVVFFVGKGRKSAKFVCTYFFCFRLSSLRLSRITREHTSKYVITFCYVPALWSCLNSPQCTVWTFSRNRTCTCTCTQELAGMCGLWPGSAWAPCWYCNDQFTRIESPWLNFLSRTTFSGSPCPEFLFAPFMLIPGLAIINFMESVARLPFERNVHVLHALQSTYDPCFAKIHLWPELCGTFEGNDFCYICLRTSTARWHLHSEVLSKEIIFLISSM